MNLMKQTWQLDLSPMLFMRILKKKKKGFEKSEKPGFSTKMSFRFGSYKNKNWSSTALLILQYRFFFWIQKPSIFSSCFSDNDSIWAWVTAWPQPAFSTHWQKWRVNCGRHCKGEWLWVRAINGCNLAPVYSYCTYFHLHQMDRENYPPYFD